MTAVAELTKKYRLNLAIGLVLALMSIGASAQKQLVLLKGDKVVQRYYPGDDFYYRSKGSGVLHRDFVNNLFAGEIMTFNDTINFVDIRRVYLNEHRRYKGVQILGTLARAAGLFFLFDDANTNLFHGRTPDHKQVAYANIYLYDPGVSLMFIRRKSFKLKRRCKLLVVEKGSIFYQPDPKGYLSPFMEH